MTAHSLVAVLLLFTANAFLTPLPPTCSWRHSSPMLMSTSSEVERPRRTFTSSKNNNNSNNNNDGNKDGNNNGSNGNTRSYTSKANRNNPRSYTSSNGNKQFKRNNNNYDGGTALKLTIPRKVQRIVDQVPQTDEERQESLEQFDSNKRRYASTASDAPYRPEKKEGTSGFAEGAPTKADSRKRKEKPGWKPAADKTANQPARRRQSLRVGTGKKGRGAELTQRRGSLKKRDRTALKEAKAEAALERRRVTLPDGSLTVSELAELLDEKPVGVIKYLMTDLGVMAGMTQSLDPPTCAAVVKGFGKIVAGSEEDIGDDYDEDEDDEDDDDDDDSYMDFEESALSTGLVHNEDDESTLQPRAPVVTIMGHVDHGKTSLLDTIRNTKVVAGEAGGITQHIASYEASHKGKKITFIDTPGHAAFTDMRERGANITDLVILVVAADDGVKQQTADSIACARQAGVPLIIAINKCDLETADPVRVMTELTNYDILTEDLGGDVLVSQISAKQGTNIDDLLDKIMLQAEIQDLKANPDRDAEAIVVEAYVEKGLGTVATALVKTGTLKVGDIFVAGESYGRVRALLSTADSKQRLKEAGPSTPVKVVGFEGVPNAGDYLVVAKDEQTARVLAESRQRIARERSSLSYQAGLMSSVARSFSLGKDVREMCVVVKADVQGSAEALSRALSSLKLENDEAIVSVKVLISEAGEVSKSDIAVASVTPDTTVIAFNIAASAAAMEDARTFGVPIEYYSIVYDAIESVESRMQEVLSPTPAGEYVGSATVQEVFNIGGTGNIAGSKCNDGYLKKGANVRVMRGDKILIETRVKSLRSFKSEVDNIEAGNECGIGLIDFEIYEPGDVIECYVE